MKRLALCIGNDSYHYLPALDCCAKDSSAISEKLKELGFDVICQNDLDRNDMNLCIANALDQCDHYDAFLFYYAGHGFQIDGDNVLAPIDLNANAIPQAVKMNAYPISEILNQFGKYLSIPKVIILDSCRDNLNTRGSIPSFGPVSAPQGSLIAFSTSPGQASKENVSTGHGLYTEALLNYISLPRVPIETVFKRVRESLVATTGGSQIPWEHTSLIGDFYLNPDTIYDVVHYSAEALSDSRFRFSSDSVFAVIVEKLKSHNWPIQAEGIQLLNNVEDYEKRSRNELFVVGRNIYQSACGNSFKCQDFILNFENNNTIPAEAKIHLLNGMAYEIYYDSNNVLRNEFKDKFYNYVIRLLELTEFYSSRAFVTKLLCKIEDRPIYIPGQNELILISVIVDQDSTVKDIIYKGKSVYYREDLPFDIERSIDQAGLEDLIAKKMVAPRDSIRVEFKSLRSNSEHGILSVSDFAMKYCN